MEISFGIGLDIKGADHIKFTPEAIARFHSEHGATKVIPGVIGCPKNDDPIPLKKAAFSVTNLRIVDGHIVGDVTCNDNPDGALFRKMMDSNVRFAPRGFGQIEYPAGGTTVTINSYNLTAVYAKDK